MLVVLCCAAPALAAFPGKDGLLAVQPRTGGGIVLVAANGTGERRVCPAGSSCPAAGRPSWSPDGRALVFADPTLKIVYPDGSCLDCDFGSASSPAFTAGSAVISFLTNGRVVLDGIDGNREALLPGGSVTDAVWSARGSVAVVRGGVIWAGDPDSLKRIGPGAEPSWSPDGTEIAAVRRGWIETIQVRNGRVRRVVRGTAPALSPDGRTIAFIGDDHRLMIIAADRVHATAKPVGDVDAISVDWQPIPRSANPGCQAPPGSKVLASSPAGVITSDTLPAAADGDGSLGYAYMGCLRATGRERLLESFQDNNDDSADSAAVGALTAPYVALVNTEIDAHYGGSGSTVDVFDLRTGLSVPTLGGERAEIGPDGLGGTVLGDVVLGRDGATAAHTTELVGPGVLSEPLVAIACTPGGTVCSAVDPNHGTALDSADASGGSSAWTAVPLPAPGGAPYSLIPSMPDGVACPSVSVCIAVGLSTVWTVNSAAGWTAAYLPGYPALNAVNCVSISLCVATGNGGGIAVSTDPGAGGSSWQTGSITVGGFESLTAPICSPDGTCSVSDSKAVYVSSDPGGGASTWQPSATAPPYLAEACPTTNLCVAGTRAGPIITATAPGATPETQTPNPDELTSISCPSASLCVGVGAQGTLMTSTDPAAGQWTRATIDLGRSLESIVCPSASECVASDSTGHVITSSDPTGGASAWTPALIDGNPCDDTTNCSVETITANAGQGVTTVASTTLSGNGPYLTGLALNGAVLSWNQQATPESVTLVP